MPVQEIFGDASRGGEWAAVRLTIDGERIVSADTPGIARQLEGLTLLEAAAVAGDPLAVEALAAALGPAITAPRAKGRVAVAMSGGVDSAVALLRAGGDAVGVTLRLWQDPAGPSAERACCSAAAVGQARATCHGLGLPHVTLDLREEFRSAVVDPFTAGYAAGETPNPCTRCNGSFRFDALLAFADRIGAESLWTGHYARIVKRGGGCLVARGRDPDKDQSYMLAMLSPALLGRVHFPLGDQTKEETRTEAAAAGLAAARRADSQEACFLAGDDYRRFLQRQGLQLAEGAIVDEHGTRLGRHDGYWQFTPGQRRGLGIAAGRPLYVLGTDRASNTVVVGQQDSLAVVHVGAEGLVYGEGLDRVHVKLRHRADPVAARVEVANGGFVLRLDEPAYGVARGQVAALYDGDAVVGAGVITSTG